VILPDVNVLVYAHRRDASRHEAYRAWLEEAVSGPAPYGLSDLVLSGFVRIVTHPRVFVDPTPLAEALAFVRSIRDRLREADTVENALPALAFHDQKSARIISPRKRR
jgi:toxin-antitoxin system PIN domain toxin